MNTSKQQTSGTRKVCRRGHVFYKTSDCPVCPQCWSQYDKVKVQNDLPKLGAPALRALHHKKITSLKHLTRYTEEEILALHGIGPSSLPVLRNALQSQGLTFKPSKL